MRPVVVLAIGIVLTAVLVATTGTDGSRAGAQSWHVVASTKGDRYRAIDAHAARDVWAWGTRSSSSGGATILLGHWDGARWGTVTLPRLPAGADDVNDVKVVSSRDIWAAVSPFLGTPSLAHWDGRHWSTVQIPVPRGDATLDRLFVFARRNVWAVGTAQQDTGSSRGPRSYVYAVHGNGSHWTLSTSQLLRVSGNGNLVLNDAAASGPGAIWAAGSEGGAGAYYPFAVQWDGRRWLDTPLPAAPDDIVWQEAAAITVLAPRSAWELRWGYPPDSDVSKKWVDRWDGSRWAVSSTGIGGSAIDATSSKDVWVVANDGALSVSHWNGTTWKPVQPPPNPHASGNVTPDLAALSPRDVWVVSGRTVLHFSD